MKMDWGVENSGGTRLKDSMDIPQPTAEGGAPLVPMLYRLVGNQEINRIIRQWDIRHGANMRTYRWPMFPVGLCWLNAYPLASVCLENVPCIGPRSGTYFAYRDVFHRSESKVK